MSDERELADMPIMERDEADRDEKPREEPRLMPRKQKRVGKRTIKRATARRGMGRY